MQTSTQTAAPSDRSTAFVPVEGGTETTSAEALLVAAYLVMWALLLGFLALGYRRQGKMEARIGELERAMTRGGPSGRNP
jgi:CcmD family protein